MSAFYTDRINVNQLPADLPQDFTSYARLDAFGNIQNVGTAFALHDLNNKNTPTAPVSYPFLWGTHQSNVVQWNGSAPNTPIVGPLIRNIGEVVGVFGGLSMEKAPWWEQIFGIDIRYTSTVDLLGLGHLESWVKTLRSPAWPEQYVPPIDAMKSAQGAKLYKQHCANCHQVIARRDEGKQYDAVLTPLSALGTDVAMAVNADHHMAKSLILQGSKEAIIAGAPFPQTAPAIKIAVNGAVGIALKDPLIALEAGLTPDRVGNDGAGLKNTAKIVRLPFEEAMSRHVERRKKIEDKKNAPQLQAQASPQQVDLSALVYKARPLNGIWATAPYLHNGSVPSLWELMKAPQQRVKTFWVGSREFDPVAVGFVSDRGLSEFKVLNADGQIQRGNSNLGHDYGQQLSDADKWALVEYMKSL